MLSRAGSMLLEAALGQRLTYTDKRIPTAANACSNLQRFAAFCCAASPAGLPPSRTTPPPKQSASTACRRRFLWGVQGG
eukprot:9262015-Alexandrium_andersonii.AAC.1